MPVWFDDAEKYRWTRRCKEWFVPDADPDPLKAQAKRYPFGKMQVGDFFIIPRGEEKVYRDRVSQAASRWALRRKRRWPDRPAFKFSCRESKQAPGVFVCRRFR